MKIDTFETIKSSFKDLLKMIDRLSIVDDYHMTVEVLIQTEYQGFVKVYHFDKASQEPNLFHLTCLSRFVEEHRDEIISVRLQSDLVVFDK